MIKKELKGRDLLLVGFTLFSMFFGAGNLIFPPFMGAQAGTGTWLAFIGFAMSAVGFPILGVVAVARSGGLPALAGRVGRVFSLIFTILIYLSIGPCLAIPRTAVTSFEMAVTPFLGEGASVWLFQLLYSVVFFGVALLVALRPEKLTDRLGKVMCPILIVLIVAVFVGCIFRRVGSYGAPSGNYMTLPAAQGFLDGYQTMDTIAALNFGLVIALNIRARGINEEKAVVQGTVRAGWIAGAVLVAVYAMLTHAGSLSGGAFPEAANGTETLKRLVFALFGNAGIVILAAIFVIACFNTCVGLISCCGEYFSTLVPRFSYQTWAIFFATLSALISNAGLNLILKLSVPVLSAIYPVAIMLILLSFFQRRLKGKRYVYPVAILCTGVASVLYAMDGTKLLPNAIAEALDAVPLASIGLGWIIPAIIGVVVGLLMSVFLPKKTK